MRFVRSSDDSFSRLSFSDLVTFPPSESTQTFISVSDILVDPSTIRRGADILESRGVVTLSLHFYVNTKLTSANKISEIKFNLYGKDPAKRTTSQERARDPLASNATASQSRSLSPIRTFTIQLKSTPQIQLYDILLSDDQYKKLPVKYQSESQTVSTDEDLSVSRNILTSDAESTILQRILFNSKLDPTDYLSWNYISSLGDNNFSSLEAVIIDNSKEFTSSNFVSLSSKNRQRSLSQKNPDSFYKNSDINSLYRSSARSYGNPALPLKRVLISSSLREYQVLFNIETKDIVDLLDINRNDENFYIVTEILDSEKNVRCTETSTINLKHHLQDHKTPVIPADIKVSSTPESGNIITVRQNDYLSDRVKINRMIINPNNPQSKDNRWSSIATLPLSVLDGPLQYIDRSGSTVIYPNITVYEVVSSGPGKNCPTSKKVVVPGRKRNPGSTRPTRSQTHCSIFSYLDQQNNRMIIKVSDIPSGISKVSLRRQLLSTSTVQNDSRYHDVIKTAQGTDSYQVGSRNLEYEFVDSDIRDRCVYRYYAEFDSETGKRTESASDEITEARIPERGKIQSALSLPRAPTPENLSTSFDLSASFNEFGLQGLNDLLSSQGIADLFKNDIRTDRNQISKLLVFEVSRKNTRTGEKIVWPSVLPGEFIDNEISRGPIGRGTSDLIPGDTYVYTACLNMINPESLFSSSSTERISADGLRRIQISAKKFAEDVSMQPGKMRSPTTLSKTSVAGVSTSNYFTGISHTLVIKVPNSTALIESVTASRSNIGRPANVIRWRISNSNLKNKIYCFRIDVITNKSTATPLMTVSPNSTSDGVSYEVRDEINVRSIKPVQYIISVISTDMSRDAGIVTPEIDNMSSYPARIIEKIISTN